MNTHRGRRRLIGLLVAAMAWGVALPVDAAVHNVDEIASSFSPQQIEIPVGDTVVWTNRSSLPHSVTFDGGPDLHEGCERLLALGCQGPGETAERTFTSSGTFPYHCKIHGGPGGEGMAGVVVVSPAPTTTSLAPSTTTTARATTTTSSTTTTTRPLATSSTLDPSSTTSTTDDGSSVLLPGEPPPLTGDDANPNAAGQPGGSDNGRDTTTVVLIVALLLAVSVGGGYLLWRLRPGQT